MKGKNIFSSAEITRLKELIVERNNTLSEKQKSVRDKMRAIGFYGGDDYGIYDMQLDDLDRLIADRTIIIQDQVKIAVLYHSVSGTTKRMAEAIVHGINSVEGAEGKAFSIDDVNEEYVKESRCVILGTPVYYASMSGVIKAWFEKSVRSLGFAGKLAGAFATADYVHGGGELAIQSLLSHMMVAGMIAYSGGGAYGVPVIHLGPVAIKSDVENYTATFTTYGKRMASKTVELFG